MLLFLPLWAGRDTFRGVRLNGAPGSTGSTPTVVLEVLERTAPHIEWRGIWGGVLAASLCCFALQALRVTDTPGLLRAAAWVAALIAAHLSDILAIIVTTVVALLALVPEYRSC